MIPETRQFLTTGTKPKSQHETSKLLDDLRNAVLTIVKNNPTASALLAQAAKPKSSTTKPTAKPSAKATAPGTGPFAQDETDILVLCVRKSYGTPAELAAMKEELAMRGVTVSQRGYSVSHKNPR